MSTVVQSSDDAIAEWRQVFGEKKLCLGDRAMERYGPATEGISRQVLAAFFPENVEEVVAVVKIAQKYKVPLYPISTGHNWGYGSTSPVVDGCVVVDLSRMNKILEMDERLGLVTVQPGVTQRQLYEYLKKNNLHFLVPTTGAGPSASLVGNALERGFGNFVPDIFSTVTSLEAVLPNGDIYRSALSEMGAIEADRAFKWGVGPYLDGLFTQGNFGIVIQMTFVLVPTPERIDEFFFQVARDKELEKIVVAVRESFKLIGSFLCMVRIQDPLRLFASLGIPYPIDRVGSNRVIPGSVLKEMCKEYKITPWTGAGRMYGPKRVIAVAQQIMRDKLGPHCSRLKFTTHALEQELSQKRHTLKPRWREPVTKPNQLGLVEAYWKSGKQPEKGTANPAKDGAGIIWYAPVIPMKSNEARAYVDMIRETTIRHYIEPATSLVVTSYKYFYGITPILFNRSDPEEVSRALACYESLFRAGKKLGFLPYRVPSHAMSLLVDPSIPFWRFAARLKQVIDPDDIIAPGRYCTTRH